MNSYVVPVKEKCVAHNASLGLECGSPLYMYPFTTAKMFLTQAAVDFEQVFEHSGAPAHESTPTQALVRTCIISTAFRRGTSRTW